MRGVCGKKRDERQTLLSASLRAAGLKRGISGRGRHILIIAVSVILRAIIVRRGRRRGRSRRRRRRIGDTIVWSPETLYLRRASRENERRCLEFG